MCPIYRFRNRADGNGMKRIGFAKLDISRAQPMIYKSARPCSFPVSMISDGRARVKIDQAALPDAAFGFGVGCAGDPGADSY
jgi:hypothetical protein